MTYKIVLLIIISLIIGMASNLQANDIDYEKELVKLCKCGAKKDKELKDCIKNCISLNDDLPELEDLIVSFGSTDHLFSKPYIYLKGFEKYYIYPEQFLSLKKGLKDNKKLMRYEKGRLLNEIIRSRTEDARKSLETNRTQKKISKSMYKKSIKQYKINIEIYKKNIKNYKAKTGL